MGTIVVTSHGPMTPKRTVELSSMFTKSDVGLIYVSAFPDFQEFNKHVQMWLKAPVIEEGKGGKQRNIGGGKGNRKGTPQGGVISPPLANLYLHLLDRIWKRHQLEKMLGARIVRYADDFVVLCKRGTERAMANLKLQR